MGFSSPGAKEYIAKRNTVSMPKMDVKEHVQAAKSHGYAASSAEEAGDPQGAAHHHEMAAKHHQEAAKFLAKKKIGKPEMPNYGIGVETSPPILKSKKSKKGKK